MVIIRLMGGLGNQLQQYALYEKMRLTGHDVRLDTSWFREVAQRDVLAKRKIELDHFAKIEYKTAEKKDIERLRGSDSIITRGIRKITGNSSFGRRHRFMENGRQYCPEILEMDDVYLEGYWACEMYYHDILPALRDKISFEDSLETRQQCLIDICSRECDEDFSSIEEGELVSIHIRRGDYLDSANLDEYKNICTPKYYDTAEKYIREHVTNPHFYIFSDDPGYAREHYKGNEYTVVDVNHGYDSYKDIGLMSACTHHISANSTFSFWGSRLGTAADKIQIRPSIQRNSQVCVPENMHVWWKDWVLINPEGEII